MAQGAAQFCRASAFRVLNGYDESQFMGEDVDFYWRLRKLCTRTAAHVRFLSGVNLDLDEPGIHPGISKEQVSLGAVVHHAAPIAQNAMRFRRPIIPCQQ